MPLNKEIKLIESKSIVKRKRNGRWTWKENYLKEKNFGYVSYFIAIF